MAGVVIQSDRASKVVWAARAISARVWKGEARARRMLGMLASEGVKGMGAGEVDIWVGCWGAEVKEAQGEETEEENKASWPRWPGHGLASPYH